MPTHLEERPMSEYLSRSAWTTAPSSSNGSWGDVVGIALHYPADGNVIIGAASAETIAAKLRGYRDFHVKSRRWGDIGYNFAIDQAGRIWELRGLGNVGSHCASASNKNANTRYVGVLFLVGNSEPVSDAAVAAFRDLRARVLAWRPRAVAVTGHGQVPGASTSCPGGALRALISDGALTGTGTPAPAPVARPAPSSRSSRRQPGQDVRRGDTGPGVGQVQGILKSLGFYDGKVDDAAGPQTDAAIRAFQQAAGIDPDGSFGPDSRAHAAKVPAYPGSTVRGNRGNGRTHRFQTRLKDLGHYGGDVDDSHGPATDAALRAFQTAAGITVDGSGGPQTWTALWAR
jgi:peptidoglycan hydrolase-like protein with peptidoglycan-binding domain